MPPPKGTAASDRSPSSGALEVADPAGNVPTTGATAPPVNRPMSDIRVPISHVAHCCRPSKTSFSGDREHEIFGVRRNIGCSITRAQDCGNASHWWLGAGSSPQGQGRTDVRRTYPCAVAQLALDSERTAPPAAHPALKGFHPAVAEWFARRFPEGPTPPQAEGWPLIRSGRDTLIAAPTGSGKTLAGFLVAIDSLYRSAAEGIDVESTASVVYVSPSRLLPSTSPRTCSARWRRSPPSPGRWACRLRTCE